MEQLAAFYKKVETDNELMEKFKELDTTNEGTYYDGIIALAAEYGLTVTKEDLKNSRSQSGSESGEIGEEELENVTGGLFWNEGNIGNPRRSSRCARTMSDQRELRNGRTRNRCTTRSCNWAGGNNTGWYHCRCWGTDFCVDRWHDANRCN